jgi:hypothetical protein
VREALKIFSIDVAQTLSQLGWRSLAQTDQELAVTALFEEQGRLALSTTALDYVAADFLDVGTDATFVWPLRSGSNVNDRRRKHDIGVEGVILRQDILSDRLILAPVNERVCVLDVSTLNVRPLGGMAIDEGWAHVSCIGRIAADAAPWSGMERLARLALASELIGVANKMVELASAHVTDRFQFGRPIGSNQAVRFRVADAYAEVAGAQSLISAAWRDGSEQAALTAKTVAGRAHSTVVNNVLQVGGAIGLSEEHPFPHLARRGFALDALLGSFLKDEGTLAGDTAGIRLAEPIGAF